MVLEIVPLHAYLLHPCCVVIMGHSFCIPGGHGSRNRATPCLLIASLLRCHYGSLLLHPWRPWFSKSCHSMPTYCILAALSLWVTPSASLEAMVLEIVPLHAYLLHPCCVVIMG